MTKITILGAGVVGMFIASQLPTDYDITIVGHILPGDEITKEWASPFAGAVWVGVHNSSPKEIQMQLGGYAGLYKLSLEHPESSIRRLKMTEIMGTGSKEDVWYAHKVPDFRFMEQHELPEGALYGMTYTTLGITPPIFVPWMRNRLEKRGVKFVRAKVNSLAQLEGMGHDVLINASGRSPAILKDVRDPNVELVRMQTVIFNHDHDGLYIRRGENGYYSTCFGRADGTIYSGGFMSFHGVTSDPKTYLEPSAEQRKTIIRRQHENQPHIFHSPNPEDYPALRDHVGIYPVRTRAKGGARVEREIIGNQKVVHAYGLEAGGYVHSFGLAAEVEKLVNEYMREIPSTSRL